MITDTYSFYYIIKSENIYKDIYKDKELFDFSNYQKESKCYDNSNNLVAGKLKDGNI